jgi:hypothetical protein
MRKQQATHIDVIDGGPRRVPAQSRFESDLRRFPPSNFVH